MREKSQLDDMRAAIRGDLERAQARRDADPWREPEPEPEPIQSLRPEVSETPAPEPDRSLSSPFAPSRSLKPEPVAEVEPEEPPTPPVSDTKRGFLSRLFSLGVLGVDPGGLERGVEVRIVLDPHDPSVANRHDGGVPLDAELAP